MIKGIIDKVQSLAVKITNRKERPKTRIETTVSKNRNNYVYLNDPTTSHLILEEPELKDTYLPMRAIGEGNGYPLGSIQQQAAATKQMVNDILKYIAEKSPKKIKGWAAIQSLTLMPRAGKDINAYYNRNALKFFYFPDPTRNKMVFACDCRGIVAHEFGHAFLDILRPDMWSTQSPEIWAFHEAFGDVIALISLALHEKLIQHALEETKGDLTKSNILTRMAPEMGIGLFNITKGENGELPNAIRELANDYKYVQPETLPKEGRSDKLINECHSFSRILSGAIYDIFVKIYEEEKKEKPEMLAIRNARDIIAEYFLLATVNVPNTVRLFSAFCKQFLQADQNKGGKYQKIISDIFENRELIRMQVRILDDIEMNDFINNLEEPHEIQNHNGTKVVRTLTTKKLKLTEKFGVTALNDNPLLDLEITVPNESAYYFNENDKLISVDEQTEEEIIDSAYECLDFLNKNNLVGKHDNALFENKRGQLTRKQFACTCNKPNYCDPNAPEYGKPWKPKNNAGCIACHSNCEPRSCSCDQTQPAPPPKLGCYTSVRSGTVKSYRNGRAIITRKTC